MLFHSQPFLLIFLPLALAGFYLLHAAPRARGWFLIAASLGFYGYWDPRLVPLLVASVTVNWALARAIGRGHRWLVPLGSAANLAVLGVFKYADFFATQLAALVGQGHSSWSFVLPLGISFFTFQQISYLVDLRRGRTVLYGLVDYAGYVTFFPHLIAGPIVRHDELIAQFQLSPLREGLERRLAQGVVLLVIGLVKKVFIADSLAKIADPFFVAAAAGTAPAFADAWTAALAFAFQIYFDFSGYTDMAIGLALLFGYTFPVNFDAPYRATSIRDFWRRWHITLSRFLRDYLYVPLGGNRRGASRQALAVFVTMVLGGLWHGAGWTFIAWGALHGAALAVNQAWQRTGRAMPAAAGWALTMLVVLVGWVLFRSAGFAPAARMLAAMSGANGVGVGGLARNLDDLALIALAALIATVGPTSQRAALELLKPWRPVAAAAALALVLVILQVGDGRNFDFIYFQF